MCSGGSSPPPPAPAAPPPQLAQTPTTASVRAGTAANNAQQYGSTILTSGLGDTKPLTDKLGKKTLLGA